MIITIVRHGEAGDALRDKDRELTHAGKDDVSFGSHRLRELCGDKSLALPDHIFHSSWRRTTQTAEILGAAFTSAVTPMAALLPSSTLADVDNALSHLARDVSHCVLVGHQPMVSLLLEHYIDDSGRVPLLSPGGLASIWLDTPARGCGELLFWALPPEYRGYV